jgi:hypothetical protein
MTKRRLSAGVSLGARLVRVLAIANPLPLRAPGRETKAPALILGGFGCRVSWRESERERYRTQLERYARLMRCLGPQPIRLGLYFPLLSAWREWPAGSDEPG